MVISIQSIVFWCVKKLKESKYAQLIVCFRSR